MELYTRTGDDGTTGLFDGQRIAKDDLRIEAVGAVDELNSLLGLALTACRHDEIAQVLRLLQNGLFDLGADLATPHAAPATPGSTATAASAASSSAPASPESKPDRVARLGDDDVKQLEQQIDAACRPLPPMRQFILPGGSELAARLHVARAVARRAERICVALSRGQSIGPHVVVYLNRVSDLLFALARRANQLEGVADVPWPGARQSQKTREPESRK